MRHPTRRTNGASPFEALEPRQLLASTFDNDSKDGDFYRVKVTGPGAAVVNTTAGVDFDILSVIVSGTTAASKLEITVQKKPGGDGRLLLKFLTLSSDIGSVSASKVDISPAGALEAQNIGAISFGDLGNQSVNTAGLIKSATFRDFGLGSQTTFGGTAADTSSVTLGNFASIMSAGQFTIGAFVKKFSANSGVGGLGFSGGLKDLSLIAQSSLAIGVAGAAEVNSIVSKGSLSLTLQITGGLKTLSAASLSNANISVSGPIGSIKATAGDVSGTIECGNRIGSISAKATISANLTAASFGSIVAGLLIDASTIRYSNPGAKGFVIESLKAPAVINTQLAVNNVIAANLRIRSINVGSWTDGSIQANAIESIRAKTDFAPTNVSLSGESEPFSIKSITVGGNLRGTFGLASDIVSLKAGTTGTSQAPLQLLISDYGASVDILKVELTGSAPSNLNIQAKTLGTLKAKGDLKPQIQLFGADANGLSIKSLAARQIVDGEISGIGGIGSITARHMDEADIEALFLTTLTITGGDGLAGDFNDASIDLAGINSAGFSLKTLKAKGGFLESNIRAATRIGDITVGRLASGSISAGSTLNFLLPANLNAFDPAGRIDSITLTKPSGPQAQGFAYENFDVVAPTIAKITINGLINPDDGGSPLGFGARTFGTVTLKDLTGATVKPTIPTSPQNFSPFLNSADFILRVYA